MSLTGPVKVQPVTDLSKQRINGHWRERTFEQSTNYALFSMQTFESITIAIS